MKPYKISSNYYHGIVLFGVAIVGIALYFHTCSFPFVFDDLMYIVNNPLIKGFGSFNDLLNINEFAQLDERLGLNQDVVTNFFLRPVSYLTFTLNYLLSGFDPKSFRLFNIAIHIANSVLVYVIFVNILQTVSLFKHTDHFTNRFLPTATAFLFLAHPLQTESVIYINQRFTSLSAAFYLSATLLYLYSAKNSTTGENALIFRMASIVVLITGMLTKEVVVTAPLMLFVLEVTVFNRRLVTAFNKLFFHLLCIPIIPLMVIVAESAQSKSAISVRDGLNIVNYSNYSLSGYAITQICSITSYLRLLLVPYNQNIDHDYPLYSSLLHGRVILSIALLSMLIGAAIYAYRSNWQPVHASLIMFGVLWFFVTISPDSSIIPLPDLMVERRTYLPSIGFFLVVVSLLDLIRIHFSHARAETAIVIGTVCWIVILAGLTYARSNVWRTSTALWEDAVAKSPDKIRPVQELAKAYTVSGDFELAYQYASKKHEVIARNIQTVLHDAGRYADNQKYREVIQVCQSAIARGLQDAGIYYNLGVAFEHLGYRRDAIGAFGRALKVDTSHPDAHKRLILNYLIESQHDATLKKYHPVEIYSVPVNELLLQIK